MVATSPAPIPLLADWLERLDAGAAVDHVERLLNAGASLHDLVSDELLPAWLVVDQRCAAGLLDPGVSGAAAAVARKALAAGVARGMPARTGVPRAAARLAVVSPPASADLLLAEAAAALAAAGGHAVDTLTGGADADELTAYLSARSPTAVVASAQDPTGLPALAVLTAASHAAGVPVLAWGGAFGTGPERARLVGADGWASSTSELTAALDRWAKAPPRAGAYPAAAPSGAAAAAAELDSYRPALLAAASGAAGDAADAGRWARRAAQELVDHLGAAVAIGDRTVLTDHLERQRRALGRQQLHDVHLVGLVEAVGAALPLTAVAARHCLFASREELRRSVMRPASLGPGRVVALPKSPAAGAPALVVPREGEATTVSGQSFADLLLLAALACQTSFAVLSVPQSPGRWRTLGYGFDQRVGLEDPALFDLLAASPEAVEVPDLSTHPRLSRTPLALAPHQLRWAYGMALRAAPGGPVLGVVAVLDRWLRELTRREQRAISAVGRQAASHLVQLRRGGQGATGPAAAGARAGEVLAALGGTGPGVTGGLPAGQLLRSHEVAVLFDVTERTVINWAAAGKLPSLRTVGGHLRFRREDVMQLLSGRSTGARAR